MATRVRTAGRYANMGSDSDSDLGGMESYPRKRQGSVARSMTSNRITKPASKVAGSIDRKASRPPSPGRRALTDKSNLNATRPSHKIRDEKPARPLENDVFEDDSMFESHYPTTETRKKQRLEDSRPVKTSLATSKRYASSSPRHGARQYPTQALPEPEDSDDMDMVDVAVEPEELEEPRRPMSRPASVPISSHARPASRSQITTQENASLERRLREMTRKYENLEGRYTELREVGVKSAERNYEKLRKQADENAASEFFSTKDDYDSTGALTTEIAANKLIAKLKEALAAQQQVSGDADSLRMQLQDSQSNTQDLSSEVKRLTSSLAEADGQIKALQAKLAASRAAPGNTVPSSAIKGNSAKAWTGQSEMVHAAHAKEELYADLTGLIIQGMKQDGTEDIFDCIQTGRNGSKYISVGVAKNGNANTVQPCTLSLLSRVAAQQSATKNPWSTTTRSCNPAATPT